MEEPLHIEGGYPLEGKVWISGAKNACLVIMAASVMVQGQTILENVPVFVMLSTGKYSETSGGQCYPAGGQQPVHYRS